MRALGFFLLFFPTLCQGGSASEMARELRSAQLDAGECYRVRDIRLARDEIKLYLTDGFLIFSKPVNGVRVSAVFTTDVEGGDAELLLMPPTESERKALAAFAKAPNLNEHFKTSVLLFTDRTASELLQQIQANGTRPNAEMGNLMADRYNSVAASFRSSFEVRLVEDILSPQRDSRGFFFAAMGGSPLGNFDVMYDPRLRQQISVGQVTFRDERRFFDVWTSFEARSWRNSGRKPPPPDFRIDKVRIDAAIDAELAMKAVTHLRLTPAATERTISLELSQQMKVTEVSINGEPGEAFYPESLRANLMRGNENNLVLITGPRQFDAGKPIEIEIHHEGRVITPAGNGVYFVGSRGAWYPNRPLQFADYEVEFRYPKSLDLVATGELVEEKTEGEWKVQRRKSTSPVRLFGFNLGQYERARATRGGLTVEVCANRQLEAALQPKPRPVDVNPLPPIGFPRGGRRPPQEILTIPAPLPNPAARIERLAAEFATTYEEMAGRFGRPGSKTLTVSPIPGRFGQGFPGLVYLSTMAYLDPSERPLPRGNSLQQTFFSEILHAHEIAHQWWGNGVTGAGYQDDWLMEALANYSALWALERKKGLRALDSVLDEYRNNLLRKQEDGQTIESAGPVTMGHRLFSSQSPTAWPVITYEKGSWIVHMLRRRLGDTAFQRMLAQLYKQYLYQPLTTAQFQIAAAHFLPPQSTDPKFENFFEQWVYGTGIPLIKVTHTIGGKAPRIKFTATITQSEVDENFSVWIPVEIQAGRMKPIVKWVRTSSEPVQFTMDLMAAPAKVTLDPGNTTLRRF